MMNTVYSPQAIDDLQRLGKHRFRVGDYRILVELVDENINILRVKYRREVYR